MQPFKVRCATEADLETATATLADAFLHDPVMLWLIGRRRDIFRRLRILFGHLLRVELAKPNHAVEMIEDGSGAALWHGIGDWKTPAGELAPMLPVLFRTFGIRLPRTLRMYAMSERAHPEEPHLHLAFIGVRRDMHGKGLGSSLIRETLDRCDAMGIPAYLENSRPSNEIFYLHHGFESRGPLALPRGAPTVIAMWREPR